MKCRRLVPRTAAGDQHPARRGRSVEPAGQRARHAPNRRTPVAPRARLKISDQIDGVLLAAVAGLGVTLVHQQAAEPFLRRGELRALLVDHAIESESGTEVYAYFPHRSGMASRARAFIEFLANDVGSENVDIAPYSA